MREPGSLVFFYTETPLHAGSGTALGAVDLPIQRERMSGLPMVQGSGLKGAWREQVRDMLSRPGEWEEWGLPLFGHEPPNGAAEETSDFAGAMSLLDARLLLMPVRTVWGGWAWVTSPMVLQRLARDLEVLGEPAPWQGISPREGQALVGAQCTVAKGKSFIVEDLEYEALPSQEVDVLAGWLEKHAFPETKAYEPFRKRIAGQLAVVHDDDLRFLSEHATEVVSRIRIDVTTGTVADGALWSEESLPAESLLWTIAFFTQERRKKDAKKDAGELQSRFCALAQRVSRIRLGGDRTTGRGLVGVRVRDGKGGAK
jgi:CRISPR-associated protein Cmr4